jgi:LPS sulfotransferase NodH
MHAPTPHEDMNSGRFCVVTAARSGSTMLCSLLDHLPEVVCHGELFGPEGIFWLNKRLGLELPYTLSDRNTDPIGFLSGIERLTFEHATTFGFKLFIGHNRLVLRHVLSSDDYRIVLLSRRNKLAQFSSLRIAQQSNVWHTHRNEPGASGQSVLFDKGHFVAFVEGVTRRYETAMATLEAGGRPYFALDYHDIKNEQVIARLLNAIDVHSDSSVGEAIGRIAFFKQNPSNILERFSNPKDVIAAMRELEHEDWLKDEAHDAGA